MAGDEEAMLRSLGLTDPEDLFQDVPGEVRIDGLTLPPGLDEARTVGELTHLLGRNRDGHRLTSFLGAGFYDVYVPAAVAALVGRSEFATSYTPYQAEVSQGLMQALFEFQSLLCELVGLDAANSSLYDGSTALGEAALMCARVTGGGEFVIPELTHWERKGVLRNYVQGAGLRIREVPPDSETGALDLEALGRAVGPETAGIYVENPTFLGRLDEGVLEVKEAHPDPLLVVGIHPLAQAVLVPPGDYGADIAVGEGQPLGNPVSFGGPALGLFACRREHVRKMPGRVIGLTRDAEGRRAYAMTLQTREQHIRRGRAMSNICTNESLLAVAAAVYMSLLGGAGLRALAASLMERASDLAARIDGIPGFQAPLFPGVHFNEFPVALPVPGPELDERLLERGLHGGLDVSRLLPDRGPVALYAVTDRHGPGDFDRLVRALEEAA